MFFEKQVNMGRATEMGQRQQLIELKLQGVSLQGISEGLQIPYGTVRKLSAVYKQQHNLQVHYNNCGPKQPLSEALLLRAALWLKRLHSLWGAPLIHLHLQNRYGAERTPCVRTLQRWFRLWQLNKPRNRPAQQRSACAQAPHNIWQVDAKENLTLRDGSGACYLSIIDEYSGAALEALVFPPPADPAGACR